MVSKLGEGGIVIGAARSGRADAIDLVRAWFDAMTAKDLPAARAMMSPATLIVVSGGHRFTSLDEFARFAAARYSTMVKQTEAIEVCEAAGGIAVYARGRLSGSFADGRAFDGVRWCDRFLVNAGRIVDLQTWSDIAEYSNERLS